MIQKKYCYKCNSKINSLGNQNFYNKHYTIEIINKKLVLFHVIINSDVKVD